MSEPLVGGKYRLVRRLGGGGMADVFLAQVLGAEGFARTVVIKKMKPELSADPEFVRMFLEEARLVSRLHHANICQVFDFGADPSGHYLVMEYLDGADARTLLRAARPRGGMPLAHVLAIASGAASGLHYAHELTDDNGRPLGLVHRDVSPSNIMVTFDGAVKLIDFGIARVNDRPTRTLAGQVKGTVSYMSPEQVTGTPLDRRSDLFSLGIAIYELVTAERPFERAGEAELQIMERIAAGTFKPASHVRPETPRELDALIARLLAIDPAQRPATADELAGELEAIAKKRNWTLAPRDIGRVAKQLLADSNAEALVPATLVDPASERASLEELLGGPRVTAPIGAPARATLSPATRDLRTPATAGALHHEAASQLPAAPVSAPTVPLAPTNDLRAQRPHGPSVPAAPDFTAAVIAAAARPAAAHAPERPPARWLKRRGTIVAFVCVALIGLLVAIAANTSRPGAAPSSDATKHVFLLPANAPACVSAAADKLASYSGYHTLDVWRVAAHATDQVLEACTDTDRGDPSFAAMKANLDELDTILHAREKTAGVIFQGFDGDEPIYLEAGGNKRLSLDEVRARSKPD